MGNTESHQDAYKLENEQSNLITKKYYFDKYNWVPSLPGHEYLTIDNTFIKRKFGHSEHDFIAAAQHLSDNNIQSGYVDLRTNFPQIISMDNLPINPIISVVYMLHYQLLKNKLPIFPPSSIYIYKNIEYYKDVNSLFSFEVIFNSIKNHGFCSESELATNELNLGVKISNSLREKACAFKFIDVYKVLQNKETIKQLLMNEMPILIGFTVYYDMITVDNYMWMPDERSDKKLGGLTGVLVGYIEERKMFIMATTFGKSFGASGYILIPYDYVLSPKYTSELFTIDFKKERVEGYINQRKEMINLQNNVELKIENKQQYSQNSFGGLFK